MQFKKRYLVVVLFLLLGLTTFTFASPREVEKQKPIKGISERVANDKKENKSYAEALQAVEDAEENPTLDTVETARNEIRNANDATVEQITQLQNRVNVVEETIDVAALVKEVETLAEVKETRETAREKYLNAETEVNKLDEGEVKNNLTERLEKVLRLLNDTTAPEITGVTNGSIVNKSENIYVSDEFLYDVKITGPNSKGEVVTKEFKAEDFIANENNDAYTMKYKANYEGRWTVVATDKAGNTKTETFTIDKTAAKKNAVNANVNGYKNEVKEQYATNGDTVTAYISINEELKYNPTFTFYANGKEIKVIAKEDVVARPSSNEKYPYVYEVKLAIDENLVAEDGDLTFTVTDIVDKAGNKTADITKVSNGKVVKLDRTPNRVTFTSIKTSNNVIEKNTYYVKNGDTVTLRIGFREKLGANAVVKIGGREATLTYVKYFAQPNHHEYTATLTIPENECELVEGALSFTIENVTDEIGNKGFYYQTNGKKVLETVTKSVTTNGKNVIYDRTVPTRKSTDFYVSGLTQIGKTFYTQYGKKVVVNITTDEELAEVPTFTLHNNGNDYAMNDAIYRGLNDKGYHLYQASLVIAKDLGMTDGEITFTVSNIKDKAGNVRDNITEPTNGRKVVLDNVLKVDKLALVGGVGLWSKDMSLYNQYATTGTTIYVNARFKEELAETPVVTLNETITLTKATKQQSGNIWIYSYSYKIKENDGLKDGLVQVKVTGIKDFAGNTTELTNEHASMKSQKNILIDRTAPTYRFTKTGSSLVKDEIKPIEKDGLFYFEEPVRVTLSDAISLRLHGVDSYYDDKNPNRTGWLTDVYQSGEHTAIAVDSVGHKTEFKFVVGAIPPVTENNTVNLTDDITLVNKSFYNNIKTEEPVTINGNGKTVTQIITSDDKLIWKPNNLSEKTNPSAKNIPVLGNVFSSLKGAKVTVNDITLAGTHHSIMLGNYEDSSSNWFNTEFNNVNIINTNVVSLSANIAPAAVIYGNATLNNVNIYGTKRSELEVADDERWPFWPVYDLAAVNSSTTTINGGKIGTMYLWAKAVMTINNAEVGTIDTLTTTGHLEIGSGTTVDRINMNGTNAYKPDVTVKAGATVKVLDLSKVTNFTDIIIEPGATVETVITKDGEMSYDEWIAAKTPLGKLKLTAKNGGTYTFTESLVLDEILEIPSDKTVVLDLNNKELKLSNKDDSTERLIKNAGNLTVKNGTLVNDKTHAYGLMENAETGEVTFENINITDKGNANSSAIQNKGKIKMINSKYNGTATAPGNAFISSTGDLEITNSEIKSTSTKAYSVIIHGGKAVITDSTVAVTRGGVAVTGGDVTINNANIETKTGTNSYYAVYVVEESDAKLTINGGNYTGYKAGLYAGHADKGNLSVTINSGTFTGTRGNASAVIFAKAKETPTHNVEFVIKGGTYKGNKHDVSAYLPDGYKQNSTGEVVKND